MRLFVFFRWWIVAALFLSSPGAKGAEAPAAPCHVDTVRLSPGDPRLAYRGRWSFEEPGKARVSWAGASLMVRFRGTSVAVDLDPGTESEQFRVVVDGSPQQAVLEAAPGRGRNVLAADLAPGRHTVELMKETYYTSETVVHGVELLACEVLAAPSPPPRRIAFFGDSNMDGTSLYDEKDGGDSGAWFAYPATTARMLDADFSLQAFGGAQLAGEGENTVLSFITAQRRDRPDPDYRDGYEPQLIVVNAGANDVYAVPDEHRRVSFRARFAKVVARLRAVYGEHPHIVLYNAYGWHPGEPANDTPDIAAALGERVHAIRYPWIWEQFHGAMAEHGGQARFLAESIAALDIGFSVVHELDSIDGWGRHFDVANGGFEASAPGGFDGFGWRYADDGVARLEAPQAAFEGVHFIRLEAGESVHQGTDATGDFLPGGTGDGQRYEVRAMVRAPNGSGTAGLQADFEAQAMYGRGNTQTETFAVGAAWTEIRAVFTAPPGSWKTFITLASEEGTVDFDAVRMSDPDGS